MKKIEPAVMELNFRPDVVPKAGQGPGVTTGVATYYIDLNQVNSLLNRRFYRQGLINAVASIKITTQNQIENLDLPDFTQSPRGEVQVAKLPNTWVMANAWMKGFATWQKMNREALDETESVRPKFLDFKIYADSEHHQAGSASNLLPVSKFIDNRGVQASRGEWEYSKFIIPASGIAGAVVEREVIATGENYPGAGFSTLDAVSLIEGYANSRGLPDILDPNAPDDAADSDGISPENWLTAIFNDGTQQSAEILESMVGTQAENNTAPYPFENGPDQAGGTNADTRYPGGETQLPGLQVHDFERISGTTIGGTTYLRGGAFPCGLMKITISNYSDQYVIQPVIQINLVPGHHRGLLCEPMTEM